MIKLSGCQLDFLRVLESSPPLTRREIERRMRVPCCISRLILGAQDHKLIVTHVNKLLDGTREWRYSLAPTGRAALYAATAPSPAAVVSDIHLPLGEGLGVRAR